MNSRLRGHDGAKVFRSIGGTAVYNTCFCSIADAPGRAVDSRIHGNDRISDNKLILLKI